MNIITHTLAGWCAGRQISDRPRDAVLLTVASIFPDIDGIGALVDIYRGQEAVLFSEFHHKFGHNLFACLALLPLVWYFARNFRIMFWFTILFHFHLFCDIVGARGPDGFQWPVYYFFPLNDLELTWSGQWEINAWPNFVFTLILLFVFFRQILLTGFSPLGLVSHEADSVLVDTLSNRFGHRKNQAK